MAISRVNMEKQMSRKTKKMGGGGLVAPIGIIPQMIYNAQNSGADTSAMDDKKKRAMGTAPTGMAKGGKVRGDGCATRGKTKGQMR